MNTETADPGLVPEHVQGIREFFAILDRMEVSDNGALFHPTVITTARALELPKLKAALAKMKSVLP